jgi:4a-hydroxytetrahydrobiopterin dehydratase
MKRELLSAEAIQHHLAALPGWQVEGRELVREFRFPSYLEGISFVQRVALLAEAQNHHPDLHVGWRRVTVRLSTHSAGGLTTLDFELAAQISATSATPAQPGP